MAHSERDRLRAKNDLLIATEEVKLEKRESSAFNKFRFLCCCLPLVIFAVPLVGVIKDGETVLGKRQRLREDGKSIIHKRAPEKLLALSALGTLELLSLGLVFFAYKQFLQKKGSLEESP